MINVKTFRTPAKFLLVAIVVCALGFGISALYLEFSLRRSLLQALNLPLTQDHFLRARDLIRMPSVEDIPAMPAREYFAEGVSYQDLLADGEIQLSIYREQTQKISHWEEKIKQIQKRAGRSGVRLRILPDIEALQGALKTDDLVLFSGHSNLGQGLTVRSGLLQTNVLWRVEGAHMPNPIPEKYRFTSENIQLGRMPKVENRVFIHLGCRSGIYYLEPLLNQSPDTFFLFTNYEWAPGSELARAVDLLCQTLEKRQRIEVLTDRWEELYKSEVLTGRSRQIRNYPEETVFPESLFRAQAPR